jgi:two-component system cell cycle sensor histidine kinase/response regulator CckA
VIQTNANADLLLRELEALRERVVELEQANAALEAREGRYRDLIENARDMIWTVDLTGGVTFLNSACEHITGYGKQELLGKELSDLVDPCNLEQAQEALSRKWKHEKSTSFDIQIVAKNGRRVDLEVNSAILERDGRPAGILAIARDISERKLLQDQLQQSNKLEAVGRLAGGVAHDFNNLLTVIAGYSQLLLNRIQPDHPMFAGLDQIRLSADRAAVLTRQLLAFSRRQPLQPAVLDLNQVLGDMGKMLRRLIGEHIELATSHCPEPCLVHADASQIEQIVMNLVLNANDAMPEGGTVTIETANIELTPRAAGTHHAGRYARVSVIDTGGGIDNETRGHLFEPFFTTKGEKGAGLGLSAVYGMVEQHGGFVRVSSERGAGSRFDICLPGLPEFTPLRDTDFDCAAMRGSETVLVVEDEGGVLKLIGETLRGYGYRVIEANDSAHALDMAQLRIPRVDLLLTDIVMPAVNGRRLADAWRSTRPDLKVLYMSGYTDNPSMGEMLTGLGDHLLQKPFSGAKLALKVREVLDDKPQ